MKKTVMVGLDKPVAVAVSSLLALISREYA